MHVGAAAQAALRIQPLARRVGVRVRGVKA